MFSRLPTILVLLVVGCAPIDRVAREATPAPSSSSQQRIERNYSLGTPARVYVGEAIVRVKDFWETTTVSTELASDRAGSLRIPPLFTIELEAGHRARVTGTTEKDGQTFRLVQLSDPKAAALWFLINEDGTFEGSAVNQIGQRMGFTYMPEPSAMKFSAREFVRTDRAKGWTNFEIVYSGATKDTINLLYREYTQDDLARPAFTQALTYDRSSPELRFRQVLIEVLALDNQSIEYVVREDGLAP